MRFKQFLQENSERQLDMASAVEYCQQSCKSWLKSRVKLYRASDKLNPEPMLNSITSRERLRGSFGLFNAYVESLPTWEGVPKRGESILCSTPRLRTIFGSHGYIIIPFDNQPIAAISDDYNYKQFNLGSYETNPSGVESAMIRSWESLTGDDVQLTKPISNVDGIVTGLKRYFKAGRITGHTNEFMRKYKSPEDLGIQYSTDISKLELDGIFEVWFSGRYLQIPIDLFDEFEKQL